MSGTEFLVIGIGNAFRQDDGVGLLLAERLGALQLPDVEVITHHGEGTGLMSLWNGREIVVAIDAVSSGQPAGTLFVIDATNESIPSEWHLFSSHAFGLGEAVKMARSLGELPKRLWIVGIEGKDFKPGQGLSPEVAGNLAQALVRVRGLITHPPA